MERTGLSVDPPCDPDLSVEIVKDNLPSSTLERAGGEEIYPERIPPKINADILI